MHVKMVGKCVKKVSEYFERVTWLSSVHCTSCVGLKKPKAKLIVGLCSGKNYAVLSNKV